MPVQIRKPGKGPKLQLHQVQDFRGGLNLTEDLFRLAPNETPDVLNVDWDRRGGLGRRRAVEPVNTTQIVAATNPYNSSDPYDGTDPYNGTGSPINSMWLYQNDTTGGFRHIMAQVDDQVFYSTGGNFTTCSLSTVTMDDESMHAATMLDVNYIQRWRKGVPYSWDGSSADAMTDPAPAAGPTDFQDDYDTPSGSHMPRANLIAQHLDYMWVGYTEEYDNGETANLEFPSRIRWSHPGDPGSWAENDWIQIQGDGDDITALVPFNDHLLVFKHRSIHAVYGYNNQTWQVVPISERVGTLSQHSVVATPMGVFFFNEADGLYLYTGSGQPQYVFEKLKNALFDGTIDRGDINLIHVGYVDRRIWVSFPFENDDVRSRVYVLDLSVGEPSWTFYNIPVGNFVEFTTTSGVRQWMGSYSYASTVLKLEEDNLTDDFGGGATSVASHYRTPWYDMGSPFVPKRWKRPEFLVRDNAAHDLTVEVYKDYNADSRETEFTLTTTTVATGAVYGTAVYGTDVYAEAGASSEVILRGASLGSGGRAVSLRFVGSLTQDVDWGLSAMTIKYRPRRPRS